MTPRRSACYSALRFSGVRAAEGPRHERHERGGSLGRQPPRRGFFWTFMRYWLPVLVYLTVIFSLSAQPNLRPPFEFQNSDKLCHLLEYGGLGLLLGRAVRGGLGGPPAL